MDGNPDFRDLLLAFNEEKVRYLLVGGYALIHHTEPRYTKDIDVWVEPTPANARKVLRALQRFGAPLEGIAIEDFTNPRMVLQIGIEPNRVDVLTGITGVRFPSAWKNRVKGLYGRVPVQILGLSDLMRNKRRVKRPRDLADLEELKAAAKRRRRGNRKR